MSPDKTGPDGCFRIDWNTPIGRLRLSLGTKRTAIFQRRKAVLRKLIDQEQVDVLRAFRDGVISIEQLVDADRAGKLKSADLLGELRTRQFLWHREAECAQRADPHAKHNASCLGAVDRALLEMGRGKETRRRYATSLKKLAAAGVLGPNARVSDLANVDWVALKQRWVGSGTDWNHLRRAVSSFLTVTLGHVHHPLRLEIMTPKRFPIAAEVEHVPDIPIDTYLEIVAAAPEHARPCYWSLVLSGMRLGEYMRAGRAHLNEAAHRVFVPGTKTDASAESVYIDEDLWGWIVLGIPSPLKERWLREYWMRACVEVGAAQLVPVTPGERGGSRRYQLWIRPDLRGKPGQKSPAAAAQRAAQRAALEQLPKLRYIGPTPHSLRHCLAQWADEAGATRSQIQVVLRHKNPKMTARYERRRNKGEVAKMVGDAIKKRKTG
jgi:integrase